MRRAIASSTRFSFCRLGSSRGSIVFFFNYTATTEIYTLSLHDALPILKKNCKVDEEQDGAFYFLFPKLYRSYLCLCNSARIFLGPPCVVGNQADVFVYLPC